MTRLSLRVLLASSLVLASAGASAQSANMSVSASIAGSCSVVANALQFSIYDPTATTPLQATTTVALTCSTGAGASLAMGIGGNSTGTGAAAQRRLRLGATTNYLNYAIFQPVSGAELAACGYSTPWGNGTTGGSVLTISPAASGTARTYNVCGQMPAQQAAPVGTYTDTVVVTANL